MEAVSELNRREHLERCVAQLESGKLSVKDSEDILFSFMFSYFAERGYTFSHAPESVDSGVDFIGINSENPAADKIGVVYKSFKGSIGQSVVSNVVGKCLGSFVDRLVVVTNATFSERTRRKFSEMLPAEVDLIDVTQLRSWEFREGKLEKYDFTIVDSLRKGISDSLVRLIAANPRYLEDIEWRELERVVQLVFEELGFDSELTPGEKDGGKDVILRCKVANQKQTFYVELKHWRSGQRVGGAAAKQFINVIVNESVAGGLFLSTYGYCDNAFEMLTRVERKVLRFGKEQKIVSLCKQYVMSKSAIWEPTDLVEEVLFSETV